MSAPRQSDSSTAFERARGLLGWNRSETAEALHCSARAIGYWESGARPVDPARYELLLLKGLAQVTANKIRSTHKGLAKMLIEFQKQNRRSRQP